MTKANLANPSSKASSSIRYLILSIIAAVYALSYWFWAFPYRAALSYREQLQLFQTTGSYFRQFAERPGGIASYIAEFLTQFFNNYWIGAAIMAAVITIFYVITYRISRSFATSSPKATAAVTSLIPPISLWLYLGNPDVTLTFPIAIIFASGCACVFTSFIHTKSTIAIWPLMIISTAVLYWMAGPVTIIFTLLTVISIGSGKKMSTRGKCVFTILSMAWLFANILIWSRIITYPLSYQLIGIGYLMTPDRLTAGQVIVEALCVLLPVITALLSRFPEKITIPAFAVATIAATVFIFPKTFDKTTYRLIDYDYLVRANDWDGIINYSNTHDPDLPLSVSATNLALGMTGQLDSRAFAYFQNGVEGLVPPFAKETLSSWTTGEIFFHLGMTNSAQRFYFEGMEAIPNYNKSSRAVRRLAETAMIRGEYTLAEKYLGMLRNTIFYKKWAERNLDLLKSRDGVDSHPLYGSLRKSMIDEEYMFSDREVDKTFGQLFLKNPDNNLAKQYLMVYPLLQRDLNKFSQYMGVVAEAHPQYNPPLAQQAMAFMAMKNGQQLPPGALQPGVEQSLRDFARAWSSGNQANIEPYRRTLYHYLLTNE